MADSTACGAHLQRPHVAELHDQPALHQRITPASCTVSMPLLPSHSQPSHSVCCGVLCQRILVEHLQPGCTFSLEAQTMPAGVLRQRHPLQIQSVCSRLADWLCSMSVRMLSLTGTLSSLCSSSGICLLCMWPALHSRCCAAGQPDKHKYSHGLDVASTSRGQASQAAQLDTRCAGFPATAAAAAQGNKWRAASRPDSHISS